MSDGYDFASIEPKWQRAWEEQRAFRAADPGEPGGQRPEFYILDFFPYPSGAGLHVGHPLGYIASDIVARHMRMRGFNVLHPMGWDSFGLPAEQYAIEHGIHPAVTTRRNIDTYKRQLQAIGLSYDWSREIATSDERYYRWTQWIFLKIYNSWYDPGHEWTDRAGRRVRGAARPIETLPVPRDVSQAGAAAVEEFRAAHRLAYLAEVPVNWCPALGTVLSNEEVTADGRSERGNHPVFRRPMKQWMMRITEYADRLLADLDPLDWPDAIKLQQRNWIGRSEGAYVDFRIEDSGPVAGEIIRVFTTRPDTLFGATYMVLAPEHRLVPMLTTAAQREAVQAYVEQARRKSELERSAETRRKTGVFTGAYAVNPVNQRRIPIWVADYVLISYGTGSIMAVPGHDQRDLEFAETFGLDVFQVVTPPGQEHWRGFEGAGLSCNSPPPGASVPGGCELNGLPTPDAKRRIIAWLEQHNLGEGTVQYKLRDWLFSRQRYWGEPFPIAYGEDGVPQAAGEHELPVTLPAMDDFRPHASDDPRAEPQTPLSRAKDWITFRRDGRTLRRELNTMPNWAGSCWYYLRFCDPHNDRRFIGPEVERYWSGLAPAAPATSPPGTTGAAMASGRGAGSRKSGFVDLYLGGAEHAVLHLLYARFWHKVLYDLGELSTPEPFQKLFNQGMIGAPSYRDERGAYVPAAEVREGPQVEIPHPDEKDSAGKPRRVTTTFYFAGKPVVQTYDKMSKSKKNVVNPDDIIRDYGADTLRLYEMYMGPLEAGKPWNTRDIAGPHRFLHRVWRLAAGETGAEGESAGRAPPEHPDGTARPAARPASHALVDGRPDSLERLLHKTIRKVTDDISRFAFNTAIAQMIVWVNEASKAEQVGRDQVARFLLLLAPFAPHICEELWQRLGQPGSASAAAWPLHNDALARDDAVEIAVQVNGKLRGRFTIAVDAAEAELIAAALSQEAVARELAGRQPKKTIVVKGRLVNVLV